MTTVQPLAATSSLGNQAAAQNPQATTNANDSGAKTNDFQPTSTYDVLNSTQGIQLSVTPSTIVSLDTNSSTASLAQPTIPAHHFNYAFLALPATFLVIAIASILFISRGAKNTTG